MPKVAVIVGSQSQGSINRRVVEALAKLARPALDLQIVETRDLPLYDYELEAELPASVKRFKREIEAADAVVFATPEYLRSIPAALKNTLEWGARPYGKNSFAGKPAAIIGATPGAIGTAVAQSHLRSIAPVLEMPLMAQPEIYLMLRADHIDANGAFADEGMRKLLTGWVAAFATWIDRVGERPALAKAS
jgi:chromate reductase, NAD(P)H dehydrogenase (quinone)